MADLTTSDRPRSPSAHGVRSPRWSKDLDVAAIVAHAGIDTHFLRFFMPIIRWLDRYYFRAEFVGWENVPSGKALFVGNHNGPLAWDTLILFARWRERFGAGNEVLGLAHAIVWESPILNWLVPKLGVIPARPDVADHAFEKGRSLMVYPGGEREAFRPVGEWRKLDFYGRMGFIRLALRAGVPIVPIVSIGAQECYVVITRGERLARFLGFKTKYGLQYAPFSLGMAVWWIVIVAVTLAATLSNWHVGLVAYGAIFISFCSIFVPLPAKMRFRILPAVDLTALVDQRLGEEENQKAIYEAVVGMMRQIHQDQYNMRKLPVIG